MKKENKNGLVPRLRFEEFEDSGEWENKSLGDVCFITNGKSNAQDHVEGGLYPLFDRSEVIKASNQFLFDCEAVIIPGEGMRFVPKYYVGKFDLHQRAYVLKDFTSIGLFVYYLVVTSSQLLAQKAVQSTVLSLRLPILQNFPIQIPIDNAEQQKIAACLSSLDELIAAETEQFAGYKEHKKGLMQSLFPAEGEMMPERRFEEFRDGEEWVESTLGSAANFINGKAYKQEELLDKGKYLVLRVGNFFTNNNWYYSDLELDEDKYCEDGDLLYAWSASFGPKIWTGNKTIYHYHIWKVVKNEGIDRMFLFYLLDYETEKMKSQSANGFALLHITKGTIENWDCHFPISENEQQKIASCLSSLDELIGAQAEKIEVLKEHKKGLMQGMFPNVNEMK